MRYVRIGADGSHRGRLWRGHAGRPRGARRLRRRGSPGCRSAATTAPSSWRTGSTCYNALVVRLVLDHYPIASMRNLGGRAGACGPEPLDRAAGRDRGRRRSALCDIEHRILRPIWQDPRVHYALSCAARRLPALAAGAVRRRSSSSASSTRRRSPTSTTRAASGSTDDALEVSSLFRWYQDDFGGSERARDQPPDGLRRAGACDAPAEVRPDHRRRPSTGGSTTPPPEPP